MVIKHPPSSYDIWSKCTAQPIAVAQAYASGEITKEGQGGTAQEGDFAHVVFQMANALSVSPREFIGEIFETKDGVEFTVDAEMAEAVDEGWEYVNLYRTRDCKVWIEQYLAPSSFLPESPGFLDLAVLAEGGLTFHVFDYKHGKGKFVDVEKNGQLSIYAANGFVHLLTQEERMRVKKIVIHVVQPRLHNMKGFVYTPGELEQFKLRTFEKYTQSLDKQEKRFVSGGHCWFCPLKVRCLPLKTSVYRTLFEGEETSFRDLRSPDSISNEELAEIYPKLDFISAWTTNVRKFMDAQAARGIEFPGLKLVEGRKGNRSWVDKDKAEQYLLEKIGEEATYKRDLVTPAKAEAAIGRKNVDEDFKALVSQSEGKPQLAPEDDPRPEYREKLIDLF